MLLMLWWRCLGVDLLMDGRLPDTIMLARALLGHEELPDYEAETDKERVMRMKAARLQTILEEN